MRDSKFRVWDKEENRYCNYPEELDNFLINQKGELIYASLSSTSAVFLSNAKDIFIVEHYIGLKDKNGKYIYEGDLIIYEDEYKIEYGINIQRQVKSPFYVIKKVVFHNGEFQGRAIKQNNYYWGGIPSEPQDIHPEFYRVIGNIRENPELLEGVK